MIPSIVSRLKRLKILSVVIPLLSTPLFSMPLSSYADIPAPTPAALPALIAHQAAIAEPKIIQLSEHVYAAVNYDLAHVGLLITDNGILVFDTLGEVPRAQQLLADLREISDAPIVGLVYSHSHGDHVGGVGAFIPDANENTIPIYAHHEFYRHLRERVIPRGTLRGYMQMGYLLPQGVEGSVGGGAGREVGRGPSSFLAPTVLIKDKLTLNIGGIEVELFEAPGDLDNGIAAWIPSEGVLMAGDGAYPMMPIIATPRFEHGRSAWAGIDTVDSFRQLPIEHLLSGHIAVISGKQEVYDFLTKFRDSIQFMHDQTIRAANLGMDHDEAARWVRATLPEDIKNDPNFTAYYHNFEWMIKGLYTKALGWWNGDPVELVKTTSLFKAEKIIGLAGGRDNIKQAAQEAYDRGEKVWAAELTNMLYRTDPTDVNARTDLAKILRAIAYQSETANQRHYLLTHALILEGVVDTAKLPLNRARPPYLRAVDANTRFRSLGPKIAIEKAQDVFLTIHVELSDKKEHHSLIIRRGIMEHRTGKPKRADLQFSAHSEDWLLLLSQHLGWHTARETDKLNVKGDEQDFEAFATLFQ